MRDGRPSRVGETVVSNVEDKSRDKSAKPETGLMKNFDQFYRHRQPLSINPNGLARVLATFVAASLAALFAVGAAMAQTADVDPPGRVARVSDLAGQVWMYSPDAGEWVSAGLNRPLTSGDRLATDAGGRAEFQVGSTTVRLDASSELEVMQLDDDHVALRLQSGSAAARIRYPEAAPEFSVTTDEGRFSVKSVGRYRFDRIDATSQITVYAGQGLYEGERSALPIAAGQHAEFWIDANNVAQYTQSPPVNDQFSAWVNERDVFAERPAIAQQYVSPEMTGVQDLDRYGDWEQTPDYGAVWIPRGVATNWAPYSAGHWAWVRPWGWTWIDDAPWGFAPFHYGRWVYARNNWCWSPGNRVARPVYAPALVAWVGSPGGGSISVRGGQPAVGWFPLGPREVYMPGYRTSPRYVRNINVAYVTNRGSIDAFIGNPQAPRDFRNRQYPHAITVVPQGVFSGRQPVGPAAAQYRDTPWVRDFAGRPGRTTALIAPPVAAPIFTPRPNDGRGIRPPQGAGRPEFAGQRPPGRDGVPGGAGVNTGRPGFGQRPPNSEQPAAPAGASPSDPGPQGSIRLPGANRQQPGANGQAGQPQQAQPQQTPQQTQQQAPQRAPGQDRRGMPGSTDDRRPGFNPNNEGRQRPPQAEERRALPGTSNERAVSPQAPQVEERRALPGTSNNNVFTRPGSQPQEQRANPAGNDHRTLPGQPEDRRSMQRAESPAAVARPQPAAQPQAQAPVQPQAQPAPRAEFQRPGSPPQQAAPQAPRAPQPQAQPEAPRQAPQRAVQQEAPRRLNVPAEVRDQSR